MNRGKLSLGGDSGDSQKIVFTTSRLYLPNELGSLEGADYFCQIQANAASVQGTFKAWISNSTVSAADRLAHSTVPYVLPSGTQIASNWGDLTSCVNTKIILNETATGATVSFSPTVWTGTACDGTYLYSDCNGWTSNSNSVTGLVGNCTNAVVWTEEQPQSCNRPGLLYCFQQ